jgi:hypothetical protein
MKPSAPRRKLVLMAAPALAVAAIGATVLVRSRRSDDSAGAKVGLTLLAGPEGEREIADGAQVAASASLRFRVSAPKPCRLWLVSVDDGGQVSRHFPHQGDQGEPVQGVQTPPGSAALDGRPGLERFFAVCSRDGLPFEQVERAASYVALGGYKRVREGGPLTGLPEAVGQASVLIEKRR